MLDFDLVENFLESQNIPYEKDINMKNLTSFKIGGLCKIVSFPENYIQAKSIIEFCNVKNFPYFFLGNGSNVLACDEDISSVIICSKKLKKISFLQKNKIYCESGVSLANFCYFCLKNSLSSAEPLYGIPGTVGGAIFMNAGAYGTEIKDLVETVWHIDYSGKLIEMKKEDLDFSYRHSVYEGTNYFIFGAVFSLQAGNKNNIKERMDYFLEKRKFSQPLNFPNAGSVFKRPRQGYAAKFIEECGLKGLTIGGAKVSKKHSGFIINIGGAKCLDVKRLIKKVHDIVKEKKDVDLEVEIKFID